jgi:hypothetical protein
MGDRSGPFWDATRGRVPLPRAVATATARVIALRDAPTAA